MLALLALHAAAAELELALVAEDFDLSADTDRSVRRILSRMVGVYTGWLGLALPAQLPLRVTLVGSEARYRTIERDAMGKQGHTLGFFVPARGEAYVWRGQGDEGMKDTLVHETAHWLLAVAGAGRVPRWLNEGMAEAFENARVDGNAVWLDLDGQMLGWIRGQRVPPAAEIVGASPSGWTALGPSPWQLAEYPYGWSLVAFLLSSDTGRRALADLILQTSAASDPAAAAVAALEGWPGGTSGFDRDWRAWWSGSPDRIQLPIATSGGHAEGWIRCADGSLIRAGSGLECGRWVPDANGVLHYEKDP